MPLAHPHLTKIVATIGPASDQPETLERMIQAGMNIARLNFSHGDFTQHRETIRKVRVAAAKTGKRVAIMADLPGPKIRIGELEQEPITLQARDTFTLTTDHITGNQERVAVTLSTLPTAVQAGDTIFLNDGLIQLEVIQTRGHDVQCRVLVGGELRSRKGLNLPGINLGISAFTDHDRECMAFALENGVDAVSQSFVETAADLVALREAAADLGHSPFVIAKIERMGALEHLDEILQATDGIMVARGDLGVEIPIERIAVVQKEVTAQANRLGKPVITATQMLMSMVASRRPTRAEATDVANAILDGTDCVMLSEESAMGKHPVDAVAMLSAIAASVEPTRSGCRLREELRTYGRDGSVGSVDLIALNIQYTFERVRPAAVLVPTHGGATARNVARFRLPVAVTAFSPEAATCQALQFSYGVHPIHLDPDPEDWDGYAREWLHRQGLDQGLALLTQGPSAQNPRRSHRLEILELS